MIPSDDFGGGVEGTARGRRQRPQIESRQRSLIAETVDIADRGAGIVRSRELAAGFAVQTIESGFLGETKGRRK